MRHGCRLAHRRKVKRRVAVVVHRVNVGLLLQQPGHKTPRGTAAKVTQPQQERPTTLVFLLHVEVALEAHLVAVEATPVQEKLFEYVRVTPLHRGVHYVL